MPAKNPRNEMIYSYEQERAIMIAFFAAIFILGTIFNPAKPAQNNLPPNPPPPPPPNP